jgi:hypothetical protein
MTFVRNLHKDVVGGVLISGVGIAVATRSMFFNFGALSRMGPGYFPLALGVILTLVGIAIAVKGYMATGRQTQAKSVHPPEWRAWLLISLSIVTFVVLAKVGGLVPATFAIVFVSALGDRENSWRGAALLGLAMVAVSVVVFWWALQVQLPLFKWSGT